MDEREYWELARELAEERLERRPRQGPRSRLVDAIMVLLLSKPMRAAEIAAVFGLESKYVSSYLSYWKARGYVGYEAGLWYLTPKGEEYAYSVVQRAKRAVDSELEALARSLASEHVKPAINHKRPRARSGLAGGFQSFIASQTSLAGNKRQDRASTVVCALEALRGELSDDEFEVVNALLSHYARWGSTYLYIDQLQERLQADYSWLMKAARKLQAKNLVYIYTDPRLGLRIGLSRRLKEILKNCSG
ncbi:replication initiator protein WhiP [Stetteria hydrogenophila]